MGFRINPYVMCGHLLNSPQHQNPAHNILVENPRVTTSSVPYHSYLPSECCCHVPHIASCCSLTKWTENQHLKSPCERCGTNHMDLQVCPAANRRCYRCRRYGHYARFCKETTVDNQVGKPLDNLIDTDPDKTFDELKNKSKELEGCVSQLEQEKLKLNSFKVSLESENENLVSQINMLKSENQKLRLDLGDQKSKCSVLQSENVNQKEEIMKLEILLKETKTSVSNLESKIQQTENTCKEHQNLQDKVQELTKSSKELQEKSDTLHQHLFQVYKFASATSNSMLTYRFMAEQMKKDFKNILELCEKPPHHKLCTYCGTYAHKGRYSCPARGETCSLCNGRNHLTLACRGDLDQDIVAPDQETRAILSDLECSTGVIAVLLPAK